MHGNQLRNFSFSYHNTSFKIHIKYYTDIAVSFLLHSIKSLIFSEYDCSHARKLLWQECSLPLPWAGHLTSAKMIFVPSYSLFALKNDKIWSVNISGGENLMKILALHINRKKEKLIYTGSSYCIFSEPWIQERSHDERKHFMYKRYLCRHISADNAMLLLGSCPKWI